ncbi:MAG: hypothetical protein IT322_12745 [Anaerolineae bacterium]|nr:hypothetical protein [Anaerolineae bacterium]CAG0952637.1 hypothetical protein ANRL4_00177 [Anaerolineae bacterium]
MSKRFFFGIMVLFLALGVLAVPSAAQAQTHTLTYSGFTGSCSASGFTTNTTASYNLPTAVTVNGNTTLNGAAYDTFSFGLAAGTGGFPTGFSRTFSPALASNTFTFVFNSVLVDSVTSETYGTSVTTINCVGGVFSASNAFVPYSVPYGGPGVPSGYVLRTITCDVAVRNAPGGAPIGSDAVKAGQTFYVSPDTTAAPDGELWSQVFVSSSPNPWIPTRCVGQ